MCETLPWKTESKVTGTSDKECGEVTMVLKALLVCVLQHQDETFVGFVVSEVIGELQQESECYSNECFVTLQVPLAVTLGYCAGVPHRHWKCHGAFLPCLKLCFS